MNTGSVRPATAADLPWVKAMADRHRGDIGFVVRAALAASCDAGGLLVVDPGLGFCRWHLRRDGWATVYELVSEGGRGSGVGRALLDAVPTPRRLKCPRGLAANDFYHHLGGVLDHRERGRVRDLYVWEWSP